MSKRVAIVAGAGGGLGQATARALVSPEMTVVGVDRSEAGLRDLPAEIRREVADASDPATPGPLVERITSEVGPPDILVNTIGAHLAGDSLAVTPEALHQMIDVNLGPALWLSQAVVPAMKQRGSGAIVHVGARPGVEPTAGATAYAVSKAALAHLVRILDVELRGHGIRVNAVLPRLIATPKNEEALPARLMDEAVAPEAIAAVIALLADGRAAPVNGALIPVYGG